MILESVARVARGPVDSGQLAGETKQLAPHHCGGLSVVLRTTGAVLVKELSSAKTLLSAFKTSPVATLKLFKPPTFHQPLYRLETCFSRLKPNQQADLVWLAVFPRKFIGGDAKLSFSHRFDYDLKMFLRGLVDTSCSYPLSE
ncbi:hypothetical protein pdam_00000010 [Pocillopora damicornis]|uniref:Uncharacterized protein n=1 Tax=Pocillopora damicornis TaxID=46731 RepID=A0A3M6UXS3_POCDA|nr:hypothetical protein pdam_00000010 [Pocillopora damicornis]